jgi:hypothetical protein
MVNWVIALTAFCALMLSLIPYLRERKNLVIRLIAAKYQEKEVWCDLMLINASSLPLAIYNVVLTDEYVPMLFCVLKKQLTRTEHQYTADDTVTTEYFSADFPLVLTPFTALREIIIFDSSKGRPAPIDNVVRSAPRWRLIFTTSRGIINTYCTPPTSQALFTDQWTNRFDFDPAIQKAALYQNLPVAITLFLSTVLLITALYLAQ